MHRNIHKPTEARPTWIDVGLCVLTDIQTDVNSFTTI